MKKILFVIIGLSLLTGCGVDLNAGVYTMLEPPKLDGEHEAIYTALRSALNTDIILKYPRTGTNLSAFTVADIDGDADDEAVVFYEKDVLQAEEKTLRINILDKVDGQWASVFDSPAEGIEVESITVAVLGGMDVPSIVVGYNMAALVEKQFAVYRYENGVCNKVESDSYAVIDINDINGNGTNEIFLVTGSGSRMKAQVITVSNTGAFSKIETELNEGITEVRQPLYGEIDGGVKAVYIDELIVNTIQTEILILSGGRLSVVSAGMSIPEDDTGKKRPPSLRTSDIDGDGVLEMPLNSVCPGYENAPDDEKIFQTNWSVFQDGMIMRKYESYYSLTDGYALLFPERWSGKVTVGIDGDLVIYAYDHKLRTEHRREIMRVCVLNLSESAEKLADGYEIFRTSGDKGFAVKLPDKSDVLVPSVSEIIFNLRVIDG